MTSCRQLLIKGLMTLTEWTTKSLPEFGVEGLHHVCFAPPGWPGKGATVSLKLPECVLMCTDVAADGEPVTSHPQRIQNIRHLMRIVCKMAVEQQAFMIFTCDTAAQVELTARRATPLLPNYQRVALERICWDTRAADRLS